MAPQNVFLFVNKDSSSPSLSRNTGHEAAIASKINKHVQQQRFRKGSVSRKNWYRPFARSDSSGPSTPTSIGSSLDIEEYTALTSVSHARHKDSKSPPSKAVVHIRQHSAPAVIPRSTPLELRNHKEETPESDIVSIPPFPQHNVFSRPGDSIDPFNNTVQSITPAVRDVLARHLHWAVSSSISAFTIHEGVRRILSTVMTDPMHSSAFLAMATAQQCRTANMILPRNEGADFYRYKATKLIREHIIAKGEAIDPYTFVDVFRLAMCEWLNGNHAAARIHFSYISQVWQTFLPADWGEQHNLEVISSEDIFLAIDMDEKPLLDLNWEPWLEISPAQRSYAITDIKYVEDCASMEHEVQAGLNFKTMIPKDSPLHNIVSSCLSNLSSIPNFSTADFALALKGPEWIVKRRLHATIHRLQTLTGTRLSSTEDVLRRAFTIILFLATTTPARRLARTDFFRLASRLRTALIKAYKEECSSSTTSASFWLWAGISGLVAVQETTAGHNQHAGQLEELRYWFMARCAQSARYIFEPSASLEAIRSVLIPYAYFESVQRTSIANLLVELRSNNAIPS